VSNRLRLLQDLKPEELSWSCGFAETRAHPTCLAEAVWHGFVLDDPAKRILFMMSSCDEHRAAMVLSADYIHAMGSSCAVPGSVFIWPENECLLPEAEFDLSAVAALEGACS
jgi:hypothetical protein